MNSSLRLGDYLGPPSKTFFLSTNLGKPFNMTDCPYVKEFHEIKMHSNIVVVSVDTKLTMNR